MEYSGPQKTVVHQGNALSEKITILENQNRQLQDRNSQLVAIIANTVEALTQKVKVLQDQKVPLVVTRDDSATFLAASPVPEAPISVPAASEPTQAKGQYRINDLSGSEVCALKAKHAEE